ncbi:MAG TPA: coenzyme F420-0:L-glutamate ligase [Candidatus Paceibacterota bacterium]
MSSTIFTPNGSRALAMRVGGVSYLRLPVRTRRITEQDDLFALLGEYVAPHVESGDVIFVSEKAVALTQGRVVRIDAVQVSALARVLSGHVRNHVGTAQFRGFGHGTAPAMQLVIEEAGVLRVLVAATVAAVTRPFGIHGAFYVLVGKRAKSVDCPMSFDIEPYTAYAKRPPLDPRGVAKKIHSVLGVEAVVVDANYLGAFSLGKSSARITERFIRAVLKDNPAGQADEMTPFLIIRKKQGV